MRVSVGRKRDKNIKYCVSLKGICWLFVFYYYLVHASEALFVCCSSEIVENHTNISADNQTSANTSSLQAAHSDAS